MTSKGQSTVENQENNDTISVTVACTSRWEMFKKQPRGQHIFLAIVLACLPAFYPWLINFHDLYTTNKNGNPAYDWPEFWELKTAGSTCVVCFFMRSYIMKAFTPVFFKILNPKYTG